MASIRQSQPILQSLKKVPSRTTSTTTHLQHTASFSTSQSLPAKKEGRRYIDRRISHIRYHLQHPLTPRPLRLSRARSLRHWTIAEAWKVFTTKRAAARKLELQKQWQAMNNALEKLRTLGDDGVVGGENMGRLYRQTLEKAGTWAGAPIEYARVLTDWPSREGWNHEWKRREAKKSS